MTIEHQFLTLNNEAISLQTNNPHPDFPSCFGFSLHKAGSTLLFGILRNICETYHHIPYISIPDLVFARGIDPYKEVDYHNLSLFDTDGYCFGGFRFLPESFPLGDKLNSCKKILLVRDPRDILVSHYYSLKSSHMIPKRKNRFGLRIKQRRKMALELNIDEYVLVVKNRILANFESYKSIENYDLLKVFRYEDVVLAKSQWLQQISEFLELPLTSKQIDEILQKYDIIPTEENVSNHVRKVIPGDYKNKLSPQTIENLNSYFEKILNKYSYV